MRNPEANNGGDECGRMSNVNFAGRRIVTRYDPDYLNGWENSLFNWQSSVAIEHQLTSWLVMSAGYFRTWCGNFTVTDNLLSEPADFDHYCVTTPVDARLPGGRGLQICGLYDIKPEKFGQVDNFITLAKPELGSGARASRTLDV